MENMIVIEMEEKEDNKWHIRVNGEYAATTQEKDGVWIVADPMACYREMKEFPSRYAVERYFAECQRAFENGAHATSTRI